MFRFGFCCSSARERSVRRSRSAGTRAEFGSASVFAWSRGRLTARHTFITEKQTRVHAPKCLLKWPGSDASLSDSDPNKWIHKLIKVKFINIYCTVILFFYLVKHFIFNPQKKTCFWINIRIFYSLISNSKISSSLYDGDEGDDDDAQGSSSSLHAARCLVSMQTKEILLFRFSLFFNLFFLAWTRFVLSSRVVLATPRPV